MSNPKRLDYTIHYNKWHNHEDPDHRAKITAYISKVLGAVLPEDKDAPILEIGCSNGLALLGLRDLGYTSLKGVDISPEFIDIARSFSLDVELGSALDYLSGVESDHFSLIYMVDVLEHIPTENVFDLLTGVYDALAPGGSLFLQVPNADSPIGMHYRYIDWTHQCSFTVPSISYLLENAGFLEITINESFPPREPKPDDFEQNEEGRRIYHEARRKFLENQYARQITRWQLTQFFPDAREFPLTSNIDVTAVKNDDRESLLLDVNINSDEGDFDPLDLTDQIRESTWKIWSLQEWNSFLEDKINTEEKKVKQSLDCLRDELLKERDRLIEWNQWLESELRRLKERNIFKAFFIDGLKIFFYLTRYPFTLGKAIFRLPSTYEGVVNRQYYGNEDDRTR